MKKKKIRYTKDEIEYIITRDVHYWRWDKSEGVFVNCWSVHNSKQWGMGASKPEYKTEKEAREKFREFLYQHYLLEGE